MNLPFLRKITLFCLIILFGVQLSAQAIPQDSMRRFAVVIGANDGGEARVRLRYAVSDAEAVMKLFQKIGGVFPIDCHFLVEPDRETLLGSLKSLQKKIKRTHSQTSKTEMIFYYSGHSDEEAVLLGTEKVYYTEIKRAIEAVDADVRIAILDSCSSGAFTRIKGGKARPPFLVDDANDMKGSAFLTSSSSDEVSQESDRLRSSFFTHYLVSGMRGAADMTQDGRVTLNEAYQYAYHETLMKTEKTLGGPQHPNYNIQMTGTGDVVMTDIRQSSAIMVFDKTIQGRLFVRDQEDRLVLEMRKPGGKSMRIGLEEGNYTISNERNNALYQTSVHLLLGQELLVSQKQFQVLTREAAVARGDHQGGASTFSTPVLFNAEGYRVIPWDFMLAADPEEYRTTLHHNAIGLIHGYSAKVDGLSLALVFSHIFENARGAQIAGIGNEIGWDMQGAQVSGVFNKIGKSLNGIQTSGIFNELGGNLYGVQTTGIFNHCKGRIQGFQGSGIFNSVHGPANAGQFAGIFNRAQSAFQGIQASGIFNLANDTLEGAQFAGISNIARQRVKGIQIAGILNQTKICDGAQFGLINLSEQQNGIPLGLINLSKNGGIELIAWGDNLSGMNLGAKFRSGHFYSIIAASKKKLIDDLENAWGGSFHYGVHVPIGTKFFAAADMGFAFVNYRPIDAFTADDRQMAQLRVMVGATFNQRLTLFIGAGSAYVYRAEVDWENDVSEIVEKDMEPLYLAGAAFHF